MKKKLGFCLIVGAFFAWVGPVAAELQPPPSSSSIETSQGESGTIKIVTHDPKVKADKILGAIRPGTSMWEVLRLLPGPNVIGVEYPSEQQLWGYIGIFGRKINDPLDQTIILMDEPGRRVKKKSQVELRIVFNDRDVVERAWIELIDKKRK